MLLKAMMAEKPEQANILNAYAVKSDDGEKPRALKPG